MAETEEERKARKDRERDELYALDISGVEWHSAPGTEEHEERVEIAYLPDGAVQKRFVRVCRDNSGRYQVVD